MTRYFLLSVLCLGLAGCKKKPPEEPAAPAPSAGQSVSIESAPAAPPPEAAPDPNAPPPPAPTEPDPADPNAAPAMDLRGSTELDDLSKMLQQFVIERKRFPTDVNEMAKIMGFRPPRLVPGARLMIDKENKQVLYVPPK